MQRRQFLGAALSAPLLTTGTHALAQNNAPITKIMVGFAPGGITDLFARMFGERIQRELGTTVIVDNKPGAQGRLANATVKEGAPNTNMFLIAPNAGLVFLELLFPRQQLGYDMLNDLVPVSTLTTYPLGMVVNAQTGAKNAKEYVEWVKADPKRGLFGTSGAGSHTHFAGLRLAEAAGIKLEVVPYRGNSAVNVDLIGGQLMAASMAGIDFLQHRNSDKVNIIGVFGKERSPLAPEVPTFLEQGFDAMAGDAWMGMWASKKTPAEEVRKMEAALEKILKDEEFIKRLHDRMIMLPMFKNSQEMDKLQREELAMWGPVIQRSGFKPE